MTTYEIRIGGELPAGLLDKIGGAGTLQSAGTTLEVDLADETGLWGLIDTLRANGVDMLEVRRQSPIPPGTIDSGPESD
jgi:hypothetical protein